MIYTVGPRSPPYSPIVCYGRPVGSSRSASVGRKKKGDMSVAIGRGQIESRISGVVRNKQPVAW